MDRVRATITKNLDKRPEFAEYFKILAVIETHELINPDICIEGCKALIEGVCKTIVVSLDDAIGVAEINEFDVPKLFKTAVKLLAENCEDLEGDFVSRYGSIINVLAFIRNKRGDISHGRVAPKPVFSSKKLATAMRGMTDSILDYMLEHYFDLDFGEVRKMNYFKEVDFNKWLDDTVEDFPIKTSSYSFLLYENDYTSYEYLKRNDYQTFLNLEKEIEVAPPTPETPITHPAKVPTTEPALSDPTEPTDEKVVPPKPEQSTPAIEAIPVPWNDDQEAALQALVKEMNLKLPFARQVVQLYLFDGRKPLAEQIVETLPVKPKLKERRAIVDATTNRLVALAEQLRPAPET